MKNARVNLEQELDPTVDLKLGKELQDKISRKAEYLSQLLGQGLRKFLSH